MTLYKVEFVFAYTQSDEDDFPNNEYAVQMFNEYYNNEGFNIVFTVDDLPGKWNKNIIPYGAPDNKSIEEILGSNDIITVNGLKYKRMR